MRTVCDTNVGSRGKSLSAALSAAFLLTLAPWVVQAQGTITFDHPWTTNGIGYFGMATFDGMAVRPEPRFPHGDLAHVGGGLTGHPNNGTPHIEFNDPLGLSMYVGFSLTNGNTFGLISVDLADPVSPSLTPVDITFNGFKWDGSTVSQTFTVSGGGSTTFQTYQFTASFALGLTRVEIPSPAWAMDNLVWIPEPSATSLLLVGLLAWAIGRRRAARP